MSDVIQESFSPNVLTFQEHVEIIRNHQQRIKKALFEFVFSITVAFDQLGEDVFERDLANELGMSPSTLNRYKSIGLSQVISQNTDTIPPVFSSLYEIALLEKMYVAERGETKGRNEVQKLISRGSITPGTETKDIRFFVDRLKKEQLEKKRQLREQMLLEHTGSIGYQAENEYSTLADAVTDGLKVKTIAIVPPLSLLTKWSDPGFLKSDIHNEFPISELRGKSESQFITCLLKIPNSRIDVGIKILNASGFNYRKTFFHISDTTKGDVILFGQRGAGGSVDDVFETDLIKISEKIGAKPFILLFGQYEADNWVSIKDPI